MFSLLTCRRFFPLFMTQLLGAFNDNVLKNALLILIAFGLGESSGLNPQVWVSLAAGIFILPFFLFSSLAGQIADKYEKSKLIRRLKMIEALLMTGAGVGLFLKSLPVLLVILFLMGTQSAFFGPLKYGILPDHLKSEELMQGNALLEASTFGSILVGTIIGGGLILLDGGITWISLLVILTGTLGWLSSAFIPQSNIAEPSIQIGRNIFKESWAILKSARKNKVVFQSMLGISWFWLLGVTFLTLMPIFAKDIIGADEKVVVLFLTAFTLGIGVGSTLCSALAKTISKNFNISWSAMGMTVFITDLFFASSSFAHSTGQLLSLSQFLGQPESWRIILDFFMVAVFGGLFSVPLYTSLITHSEPSNRSRTIAANNIMNAFFMVVASVITAVLLAIEISAPQILLGIAVINGIGACLINSQFLYSILKVIFRICYRAEVRGLENFLKAESGTIIVANHLSFLDALLLKVYLPGDLTFAINSRIANHWLVKPFLVFSNTVSLDQGNPFGIKSLIKLIQQNKKVVIFPEGRITNTGSLMKIYDGPGMIAHKTGASILPVFVEGPQFTPFSRLKNEAPAQWFPKIKITIHAPQKFNLDSNLKSAELRQLAGSKMYEIMTHASYQNSCPSKTLLQSLLEARTLHGGNKIIAEDMERKPVSYDQLLTSIFVLKKQVQKITQVKEKVGVLLPNAVSSIALFFGIQASNRTPALLNYSTGKLSLLSSCATAAIKTVFTSRRFVQGGKLEELIEALNESNINVVYLEDIKEQISISNKAAGWILGRMPEQILNLLLPEFDSESPAVVLFTSGSEGLPKGVVLTHTNLQANRSQITSVLDLMPKDIVFNALPMFHSFGLMGGMILPLLSGIRTMLFPSPLLYKTIPELIYDVNATILFGTDTFLAGYEKSSHPYDFHKLRFVFAGAEKLKEETQKAWFEKFGQKIFEGYGATETSPVLSINTRMYNKVGSVGKFLPGIRYKLEKIPGINKGGKLKVQGPNIMKGYIDPNDPENLIAPEEGWYDTGDIVEVNAQGFVSIIGRVKRFAKIAGEMVSLTSIENHLNKLWPESCHAVLSIADANKGEQLILFSTQGQASRKEILGYFQEIGVSSLFAPKTINFVENLPLLATGKINYVELDKLKDSILPAVDVVKQEKPGLISTANQPEFLESING